MCKTFIEWMFGQENLTVEYFTCSDSVATIRQKVWNLAQCTNLSKTAKTADYLYFLLLAYFINTCCRDRPLAHR